MNLSIESNNTSETLEIYNVGKYVYSVYLKTHQPIVFENDGDIDNFYIVLGFTIQENLPAPYDHIKTILS